jgi:hypothetical protein
MEHLIGLFVGFIVFVLACYMFKYIGKIVCFAMGMGTPPEWFIEILVGIIVCSLIMLLGAGITAIGCGVISILGDLI